MDGCPWTVTCFFCQVGRKTLINGVGLCFLNHWSVTTSWCTSLIHQQFNSMLASSAEIITAIFICVLLRAGSSNGDGVEPSNFGDQFDQMSFHSILSASTTYDEPDTAGRTGGEYWFFVILKPKTRRQFLIAVSIRMRRCLSCENTLCSRKRKRPNSSISQAIKTNL